MENLNPSDESALQKLESEAAETKSVLIIIDCLSKVMGEEFNEDSTRDANVAGAAWNRLKASGATVCVVHHLNKKEGSLATDFVKLSRGSAALVSSSDTAFGIESGRHNPTCFNIYPVKRRRKLGFSHLLSWPFPTILVTWGIWVQMLIPDKLSRDSANGSIVRL